MLSWVKTLFDFCLSFDFCVCINSFLSCFTTEFLDLANPWSAVLVWGISCGAAASGVTCQHSEKCTVVWNLWDRTYSNKRKESLTWTVQLRKTTGPLLVFRANWLINKSNQIIQSIINQSLSLTFTSPIKQNLDDGLWHRMPQTLPDTKSLKSDGEIQTETGYPGETSCKTPWTFLKPCLLRFPLLSHNRIRHQNCKSSQSISQPPQVSESESESTR